ncbi:MAG: Primosomal protein N' [Candidatus Ordinivivax streblomastigis]|uniref:Replication restart protein PriA n=1 Tax=Candidatus Ordinivivax streblomastigis TaxID=2540710 RepID=A0A5M8P2D9_9BACT|nr:MAG: Primosomal protein N' [Candidatus Ordinivivax streblomastigis]
MYINVILPVPLADTFTYFVPPEMEAQLLNQRSQIVNGSLVRVEFGKNKHYTGIVYTASSDKPDISGTIKPVVEVISSEPVIRPQQLRFWEWIAQYYVCKLGEVSRNVLPAVIRSKEQTPQKPRRRKKEDAPEIQALHVLNDLQEVAYKQIIESWEQKDVCLLHGVTSSGKTEIYTHLMQKTLDENRQVLFLLPEIALTSQITDRLKQFFGDKLGVFHSKISDGERIRIWNNLLRDEGYQIILGVRSSVFLPFRDLGLVIVDEEHEPSYKQQAPAPRYHARNAAIVLATTHGGKVVLGSATPSIESFHNAQTGKYAYVSLQKRFEGTELPVIIPVDVKELRRKKQMKTIFSPLLLEKMQAAINQNEQILLFQNRRGFALNFICPICDWTPKCRFCDISLTYHKKDNHLSCHYCGRSYQLPKECPECGCGALKPIGYGTEKVEEEIHKLFPALPIARLDTDTAKTKKSTEEIIHRFESGETRLLIGTQMISKGLDFEKVSLVGILNADALMNFPDFRAYERAYQLMSQVAGRAGRRKTQGEVILQTSHPEHPLIQLVLQQNYRGMYDMQMEERELFKYPPAFRLIEITLKHKNEAILQQLSNEFAGLLRVRLGNRVIGPDKPAIGKIQLFYLKKILLKIENSASLAALRELLEQAQKQILQTPAFRYAVIQYDVDPV